MTLSQLLNRPMTLVLRSDVGDEDAYGSDVPDETFVEVVGELQQQRRTEPADAGETSDSTWLLVLPAGTVLNTGDAVICDGQVYEAVGQPWAVRNPRSGAESHVECTLRRTAGDEGGS